MSTNQKSQGLNVVRIAGQELVEQFEQLVLFPLSEHLFRNARDDTDGRVDLVESQIQTRNFNQSQISRRLFFDQSDSRSIGAICVFRLDVRAGEHCQ